MNSHFIDEKNNNNNYTNDENNNNDNNKLKNNIPDYPFLTDETYIKELFQSLEMKCPRPRRMKYPYVNEVARSQIHIEHMPGIWDLCPSETVSFLVELPGWYQYTEIVDYFQEHVWVKSKIYNQPSPLDVWTTQHEIITREATEEGINIRDVINRKVQGVSKFRPSLMKSLIRLFRGKNILDFCAGWGHRLVGALSEDKNIKSYTGLDPNRKLFAGYKQMIRTFVPKESWKKYEMICCPAETYLYSDKNLFDLIVTSPPYYDYEIYTEENNNQSIQKYKTFEEWYEKFLMVTLKHTCRVLLPEGHLVLSISDTPHIVPWVHTLIKDINSWMNMHYLGMMVYGEDLQHLQPLFVFKKLDIKNYIVQ